MASDSQDDINSKIYAPLDGLSNEEIRQKVEDFIIETGLTDDRAYLQKGAFLVQNDDAFDETRDDGLTLTKVEEDWLKLERTNKWRQPAALWRLVALCALGAMVQGWDESAVNGGTA